MTAVATAVPRAVTRTRATAFLLLATFFCVTFEKVHWNISGSLELADVLTILFLLAFALTSRGVMPRTTAILLAFFAAFLLVYLAGFFNLDLTKNEKRRFSRMVEPNIDLLDGMIIACGGNTIGSGHSAS
jgi:hypothetical protein